MNTIMLACGVLCSDCAAYHADSQGSAYQQRVAEAWHRIYGLDEPAANISCAGCMGPDAGLFHTSAGCTARRCCLNHGYRSCAECPEESCELLEKAQSVWDEVPRIGASLSAADHRLYAAPYCGHRQRLAASRHVKLRNQGDSEKTA